MPKKTTKRHLHLVVSLHDVSPVSYKAYDRLLDDLALLGVQSTSLLVVPCMHGRHPVSKNGPFLAWLANRQEKGHEIVLHGYFHQARVIPRGLVSRLVATCYTNREGEFYGITQNEAMGFLDAGLSLLRGWGLRIHGFTPPAWLMGMEGRDALRAAGFSYTTWYGSVENLHADVNVPAPVLVASSRSRLRRAASLAVVPCLSALHRRSPVLRIAFHPADLDAPSVLGCLTREVERAIKNRVPTTYRDLFPPEMLAAPIIP
ncbi:MAG: polysaccharide deacetylase family protein [Deltaproteobacteria bacterium]